MGSKLGLAADTPGTLKLDGLAIFFAVFACVWTLCLVAGAVFLLRRRDSPVLRIRGIPLSLSAVAFLHGYFISVQLGYMTGPAMPGDAEYWIMGTWLPVGIALFHASNSRFLHVAKAQRRFVDHSPEEKPKQNGSGLIARFRKQDHTRKVCILVGSGMAFQVGLPQAHSSHELALTTSQAVCDRLDVCDIKEVAQQLGHPRNGGER